MPRVNKKNIGKLFKDGEIMSEFIALLSKIYDIVNNQRKKRLKGVSKSAVLYITFEYYLATLMEKSQMFASLYET